MRFNTPIEVTQDTGATKDEAKCCGAEVCEGGSTIVKTLSTTEIIDVEEVLHKAREIRKRGADSEAPPVVSGNYCLRIPNKKLSLHIINISVSELH